MKMTGSEWNAFYNDPNVWRIHVWHDDLVIKVDGVEKDDDFVIDPKATVTIESGVMYFDVDQNNWISIKQAIKNWRKGLKFKTVVVEIPNEMFYSVCEQLKNLGCKVTGK